MTIDTFYTATSPVTADADLRSNQGVAYDGSAYYFSSGGSSSNSNANTHLSKWTRSGTTYTLAAERDTSSDWPSGMAQINSISYNSGSLWVGGNNYNTTPRAGWVLEYDPSDLSHIATHSVGANWSEGGDWHDVGSGNEFWVIYHDTLTVARYSSSFVLQNTYSLPGRIVGPSSGYQGLAWIPGTDDFVAMVHEGSIPLYADVFRWTGSSFVLLDRLSIPTDECTQGVSFESSSVLLWAERFHGGSPSSDHRIIRTTWASTGRAELGDSLTYYSGSSHATNLLGAYPCRPASDTDPADITGSYNATFHGSAAYVDDDVFGNVMDFPGSTSDYASISSAILGSATSHFTFCCWVKLQSDSSSQIIVNGNKSGSNAGDWQIDTEPNRSIRFFYNNGTSLFTSPNAYNVDEWHFLVVRLGSGGATIWVDGAEKASNATTGSLGGNGQEIRLGLQSTGVEPMNGQLFDVRFYDAELSDAIVEEIRGASKAYDIYTGGGSTYSETGSGGVSAGGAATVVVTRSISATGSITVAGAGTLAATLAEMGSGTVSLAGSGTAAQTAVAPVSGGVLLEGVAAAAQTATQTGTGTITAEGVATVAHTGAKTASGTITLDGDATVAATFPETSVGSVALDGTAPGTQTHSLGGTGAVLMGGVLTETQTHSESGSGGVALAGEVTSTQTHTATGSGTVSIEGSGVPALTQVESGSGTVTLDGDAAFGVTFAYSGAGTVSLDGTVTHNQTMSETGSGPIELSGEAQTDSATTYSETGSGGLVFDGAATDTYTAGPTAAGGIALAGELAEQVTFAVTGDGGVSIDGTTTDSQTMSETGSGGLSTSGDATVALTQVEAGSGTISLDGVASVGRTFHEAGSGGMVLDGAATFSLTCSVSGGGGLVVSGTTTNTVDYATITGLGGVVLGGIATVSATGDEEARRAGALSGLSALSGVGIFGVRVI